MTASSKGLELKSAAMEPPGGFSDLAALSEAVRHLDARTLQVESQFSVFVGDFDADYASAVIQRAGRLMRQIHNSAQRVVNLPPEILCMIYLALRDEYARCPWVGHEPDSDHPDKWMRIAWVCRRWRSVALDCAPLWSRFQVHTYVPSQKDVDRLKAFLVNSRQALLTIDADLRFGFLQSHILQHTYRVRKLRLRGPLEPGHLQLLSTQDAPLLEALELYAPPVDLESEFPTLFNDVHPRLTTLALTGFLRFKPNSFSNIKHFCMGGQAFSSLDDIKHVFDMLRNLLNLQQLVFTDSYTTVDVTSAQMIALSRCPIVFPGLQLLIFEGTDAALASVILSAITVPSGQTLSVYISGLLYGYCQYTEIHTQPGELRGPGWEEICSSAQKFSISNKRAYGFLGTDIIVQSPGRELHFKGLDETLEELSAIFGNVVSRAREVWLSCDGPWRPPSDRNAYAIRILRAFLPHAMKAEKIFVDVDIARAGGAFRALYAEDVHGENVPELLPATLDLLDIRRKTMELNVKMDTSSPKAFREVREFREAVFTDASYDYVAAIHVYSPASKESLKLQRWAKKDEKTRPGTRPALHVHTQGEAFPQIQLSTTSDNSCPFEWAYFDV